MSGGGGDQDTSISVELRASVLMLIGAAVGAIGNNMNFVVIILMEFITANFRLLLG